MKTRTPRTPAEWQDAVNAAEAGLLIDSARQYGLITGGPTVHVPRCEYVLAKGRARGIVPIREGVDAYIAAFSGDRSTGNLSELSEVSDHGDA